MDLLLLPHGGSPLTAKALNNGSGQRNGNVSTVVVEGAGESRFDVHFTRLCVDNERGNFTMRLFLDKGGYQKVGAAKP